MKAIRLREQVDTQRRALEAAEVEARASAREVMRAVCVLEAERARASAAALAAAEEAERDRVAASAQLRASRWLAAAKYRELQKEAAEERITRDTTITELEAELAAHRRRLSRAASDQRSTVAQAAAERAELEAEMQRLEAGRVWTRVRDEEARSRRLENRACV